MDIFASIIHGIINTLQGATGIMVNYGLMLLGSFVTIYAAWRWLPRLVTAGSGHMGEMLGEFFLILIVAGFYLYLLTHWGELTDGVLEAFLLWGGTTAGDLGKSLLRSPAALWEVGQKAAAPIATFDTWERALSSMYGFATNPLMFLSWVAILGSFFWLVLNFGMALIEWYVAVVFGAILIPMSYLVPLRHLAEMSVGWLSGLAIRLLVLVTFAAVAVPLIEGKMPALEVTAAPSGILSNVVTGIMTTGMPRLGPNGAPKIGQTLTLVGISLLFAILAWVIPGRVARLAGGATLALGGSEVVAGAMSAGRMGMLIGSSAFSPARGASRLLAGMRG